MVHTCGMAKKSNSTVRPSKSISELLRLPKGPVNMASLDPAGRPGYPGHGKSDADGYTAAIGPILADLQERLFANGKSTPVDAKRVLLVLQGMDTSGKGGVITHAVGLVDPQGVHIKGFKAPTPEELSHDFLWRIRNALPDPGMIGIFDRSHYEDVLVVRVENLVPVSEWDGRYDLINTFEAELAAAGYLIIKCFLNISPGEQKLRLAARLADPSKYWKYNPRDVNAHEKWGAYMEAYKDALERCNTDAAPWYVIPSDRKWYRNWAIAEILKEQLVAQGFTWPAANFDVAAEKTRVAAI